MCPFLDDEDDCVTDYEVSAQGGMHRSNFLKNDKKFFLIGGGASLVAFCIAAYVMYSNSKPIDLEDLPVIRAETAPIKIKPIANEQVKHQDKTIYDNISGDKRVIVEKLAPRHEEALSILESDVEETLSDDEKKDIIQAFDELAPEKEYKINYIKKDNVKKIKSEAVTIVEERQPIVRNTKEDVEKKSLAAVDYKKQRYRLKDIVETNSLRSAVGGGAIMVQVASVPTKASAEAEYKRILHKNKFLKNTGKKIFKVDLGKSKGSKYRIEVGPFKTKTEAKRAIAALKTNGFLAYISKT